jgi:hypothetical protein
MGKIGSGLNYFLGRVIYDRAAQEKAVQNIIEACAAGADRLTANKSTRHHRRSSTSYPTSSVAQSGFC